MESGDWYRTLFEALQTKDINQVARAANAILGMPVVVTDAAFIVRAKFPTDALGDEQWDANTLNRQIEPRFVKTFTDDDHFARHDQAGTAILTDWGHYEEAPRLTQAIREGGDVIGYFAALATDAAIEPWHYEAAGVISRAFAMFLDEGFTTPGMRSGLTSPALYALLDGAPDDPVNLTLLSDGFVKDNPSPHLLFCARTRNPHNAPLEMYLGNVLSRYFEHAVQAIHEGALYILASGVTGDARGSVRGRLLAEELDRQKLACGASRSFTDLEAIRAKKWEADNSLHVGLKLGLGGPLFHYEDLIEDIACDVIDRQAPRDALETPALAALKRHDAENGTEYLKTLRAYLAAGFDRKRTSEQLHIHRNTLQYRLERIAEMQGLDVNDDSNELYFMLEDYRERVRAAAKHTHGGDRR